MDPPCIGTPLHAHDAQAVPGHERLQRGECEVKHVLVVDGVKLALRKHFERVWKLQNSVAIRGQQLTQTGDEIIDVRRMSEHVVGQK